MKVSTLRLYGLRWPSILAIGEAGAFGVCIMLAMLDSNYDRLVPIAGMFGVAGLAHIWLNAREGSL